MLLARTWRGLSASARRAASCWTSLQLSLSKSVTTRKKIERILISTISAPTEDFPVALVSDDIHVFLPLSTRSKLGTIDTLWGDQALELHQPPPVTYTTGASSPTLIDFELPEHYTSDLVYEIARMIGINLRDNSVSQFAGEELAGIKQSETL